MNFSHLVTSEDGMPTLDEIEGTAFMAELSGMPLEDCRKVLLEVWDA